ncbi:MAG: hypothetical protein QM726_12705 [Chitinophagaceae bacterium]
MDNTSKKANKGKESKEDKASTEKIYGDPVYDANEDIYAQAEKESLSEDKDELDNDLDIPGAELDDEDEKIGEEDEENNYYSLGGDEHNDLEEDRDE